MQKGKIMSLNHIWCFTQ